jgi:hypothetical protein
MVRGKQIAILCFFLAAVTLTAFWQVTQCEFTNYDDPSYVTENSHIQGGVTTEGIEWALVTGYASNWHPLTWIFHMLDVQFFGLDPYRHHLVNLIFHIATTLMLFLVLHQMTKALWQSAFVAALFALHPLHVESVAWVSERKDVLFAFFWMLVMGAYFSYVQRPGLKRRLVVLLCFALGLMAKPMLVSLPFVLILLDYWPLKRIVPPAPGEKKKRTSKPAAMEQPAPGLWVRIRPLLVEKIPFFVLAALSSVITYMVQQKGGAVASLETFPLTIRLGNAFVSYLTYMGKMLWPVHLAVLYPHPASWPRWEVVGAVLFLTALTSMVVWKSAEASLSDSGVALVPGHPCAGYWDSAGRATGHGRPVYLHSANRAVHHGSMGDAGTCEEMALPERGAWRVIGIESCMSFDGDADAGRVLANQHYPV